jgi:hypothetical protein
MNRKCLTFLVSLLVALQATAQTFDYNLSDDSLVNYHASQRKVYHATRTELKPRIDGRLDDACWQQVGAWEGGFIQQQPNQAKPPSQQTEIKILYDDTYLYIGIICYDMNLKKSGMFWAAGMKIWAIWQELHWTATLINKLHLNLM